MESADLLPRNVNMETLQESKIIKIISENLFRKAIEMMHKLADNDKSEKEKNGDIDDDTNEMEIKDNGEVVETDNDELVVDATNYAPPPQDDPTTTTTTADTSEEGGNKNDVVAKDGNDDDEAEYTKGGEEGGAIPWSKTATTKMTKTMTKRT